MPDPVRVQAGLKATIKNPNVSEEAKESARERLDGGQPTTQKRRDNDYEETLDQPTSTDADIDTNLDSRQLGGYKATLKNPNVGEEAKEHAKEVLEANEEPY